MTDTSTAYDQAKNGTVWTSRKTGRSKPVAEMNPAHSANVLKLVSQLPQYRPYHVLSSALLDAVSGAENGIDLSLNYTDVQMGEVVDVLVSLASVTDDAVSSLLTRLANAIDATRDEIEDDEEEQDYEPRHLSDDEPDQDGDEDYKPRHLRGEDLLEEALGSVNGALKHFGLPALITFTEASELPEDVAEVLSSFRKAFTNAK